MRGRTSINFCYGHAMNRRTSGAEEDQTEGSAVIGESVKGAWYFGHVDREVFPNDEE
jgi:hypothetical protein